MSVEEVLWRHGRFYIDIMIGAGERQPGYPSGPSLSLHSDWGQLDSSWYAVNPLRARFGITGHMEYYRAG